MRREDLMSLGCGQALFDLSVASAAQFGGVCDVYSDAACSDAGKEEAVSGVDGVDLGLVFDYLLGEELAFERDLAERHCLVDARLRNGLVFKADEHMNVSCDVAAIVDKKDGGSFSVVLDPPLVNRLVGGDCQRPLADRVRVCCYLVRFAGKVVGVFGDPLRVGGDPVGFFRRVVGVLGELVSSMRLEQGDDSGDSARSAEACDDQIENFDSIHDVNSKPASSEGESK